MPTPKVSQRHLRELCAELEDGLRLGQPRRAEEVLALNPELSKDQDSALDLIYLEYLVRGEMGARPAPEEYYERFPHWRDALRRQFQIHNLVAADSARTSE